MAILGQPEIRGARGAPSRTVGDFGSKPLEMVCVVDPFGAKHHVSPFYQSGGKSCYLINYGYGDRHRAGRVLTTNIEDQADHSRA